MEMSSVIKMLELQLHNVGVTTPWMEPTLSEYYVFCKFICSQIVQGKIFGKLVWIQEIKKIVCKMIVMINYMTS